MTALRAAQVDIFYTWPAHHQGPVLSDAEGLYREFSREVRRCLLFEGKNRWGA